MLQPLLIKKRKLLAKIFSTKLYEFFLWRTNHKLYTNISVFPLEHFLSSPSPTVGAVNFHMLIPCSMTSLAQYVEFWCIESKNIESITTCLIAHDVKGCRKTWLSPCLSQYIPRFCLVLTCTLIYFYYGFRTQEARGHLASFSIK